MQEESETDHARRVEWGDGLPLTEFYTIFSELNFNIKKGDHVLDLGCGQGKTFVPDQGKEGLIGAVGPEGGAVGVDINARNIRRAEERITNYLKKEGLEKNYALLVLRSAEELRESKKFVSRAADQQLIEERAKKALFHLIDAPNTVSGNIKALEKETGKRLIILYQADAHKLELCPQNYFDRIIEHRVLKHVADPFQAMKKCVLSLKVGGVAYFTDFLFSTLLTSVEGIRINGGKDDFGYTVFRVKKIADNDKILKSYWPKYPK